MFSNFLRPKFFSREKFFHWIDAKIERIVIIREIFERKFPEFLSILREMPAQHPIVHGDWGKNSVLSVFRNISYDEDGILKSLPDFPRKKYKKKQQFQRRLK